MEKIITEHPAYKLGLSKATNEKEVIQMDDDFNVIAIYPSIHEAGRQTNIARQNICKVLKNERARAGGFRWKYK